MNEPTPPPVDPLEPSTAPTSTVIEPGERRRLEHRALTWAAVLAAAAALYIIQPIAIGILLGTLLAFMAQPLNGRLQKHLSLNLSALVTVGLATVLMSGFLVGLGWLLASRGTEHMKELIEAIGPKGSDGGWLAKIGSQTRAFGVSPQELADKVRELSEGAASKVALGASAVVGAGATTLLALFFMMLSMHFVLRNAQTVVRVTKDTLPLRPEWTLGLFTEFRRVGKATLLGTVVTGLAQGVLATLGYWMCGVPDPIFYGAVTAVASLVPAVGTLLVWIPIGLIMISGGHLAGGVGVLVWGSFGVVGLSDYFIRPRLVSAESELPSLLTFAALFGGVEAFGLKGLIVGPLMMSLAVAVLRLYARETLEQRTSGTS